MKNYIKRVAIALLMAGLAFPAAAGGEEKEKDIERELAGRRQRLEELRERRELEQQFRNAQRAFQAAAREVEQIQSKLVEVEITARSGQQQRYQMQFGFGSQARIGVVVDTAEVPGSNDEGARIIAITPGSSAEEAGLQPGDMIISMNGSDLHAQGGEAMVAGSAASVLVSRASGLDPGDKVTLKYRRGVVIREVTLEARSSEGRPAWVVQSPGSYAFNFQSWPYALLEPEAPDDESIRKWRDFELVALNPDLGRYFGSTRGVLILRTPEDPPLDVKAGDVIIRIGDFELSTPLDALRSLRSFEPGQRIDVKVLRDRNVVTVTAVAPEVRRIVIPRVKIKED